MKNQFPQDIPDEQVCGCCDEWKPVWGHDQHLQKFVCEECCVELIQTEIALEGIYKQLPR